MQNAIRIGKDFVINFSKIVYMLRVAENKIEIKIEGMDAKMFTRERVGEDFDYLVKFIEDVPTFADAGRQADLLYETQKRDVAEPIKALYNKTGPLQ